MTLRRAFDDYIYQRDGQVARNTLKTESGCMVALLSSLGAAPLADITIADIFAYRRGRLDAGIRASSVNQEISILQRIMKHAGVPAPFVKKLKYRPRERRALTPEQKAHLFDVAAERPAWAIAYDAATIAANTTMRGDEIRALRVADVDLVRGQLVVPRSKTDAGHGRMIPLNDTVIEVVRRRCAADPDYYVLHPSGRPWRPVKSWRSAWESLTKAAGMPELGFHALRHQAITELAEAGVPDGVIKSIAGHVSQRMLEHYSHARVEAKASAVAVLA